MGKKLNRDNLILKTGNKDKDKTNDFQKLKTIRSFGREIYYNDLSLDDAPDMTQNEERELLDASYSVSDIQDYFEYIFKRHGEYM